jgi:hypothetical protein
MIDSVLQAGKRMAVSGLVVGIGLLGAACEKGAEPTAQPASAATVETSGAITRTAAPAVGTVKSLEGTGKQSSGNFSVTGAWKLAWSATGPIEVRVISGETFEEVKVMNSTAAGEEAMAGNCNCYLEVSSSGPYTVTVTDTPN